MWWCWWCLALSAALAHADRDRRADMSPLPFVMGSRYGRSPDRVMAPRNDRFFMGSRYGKRAEVVPDDVVAQWEGSEGGGTGAEAGTGVEAGVETGAVAGAVTGAGGLLYCQYTGVVMLYRCRPSDGFTRMDGSSPREE